MSIEGHLAKARKLIAAKEYDAALGEYEYVLDIDPTNPEALGGLEKVKGSTALTGGSLAGHSELKPRIATNFLVQQAQETHKPITKQVPIMVVLVIVVTGALYGLYQVAMYVVNFDKMQAMKNVVVHLERPVQDNGAAYVDVVIENFNPQPIADVKFTYVISMAGAKGVSGKATIPYTVPPGDSRSFAHVQLGPIYGQAGRVHAELVDLSLGAKPSLTPEISDQFIEAASITRKDALEKFKDVVKVAPQFTPAYIGLGQALAANNEMELAREAYKKAIKLDAQNANAHYNLGVVLYYLKENDKACAEFETAHKLSPSDPAISAALARLKQ